MEFRKAKLKKISIFDAINGMKIGDIIEVAKYSDNIFVDKEEMTFSREELEFLDEE